MMTLARLLGLSPSGRRRGLGDYLPTITGLQARPSSLFERDVLRLFDVDDRSRQMTYARRWQYYENGMYSQQSIADRVQERGKDGVDTTGQLAQLYTFIRSFYNPVTQTVDMDVDSIFREPTWFAAANTGMNEELDHLMAYSRFDERTLDVVRYGATTGDVYLRVVDDWKNKEAKIYVYSPEICRVVTNQFDRDIIEYAVISYDYNEFAGRTVTQHNRTDILYPNEIRTFRDGEEFAFDGYDAVTPNRLGIVPIEHIANLNVGRDYGVPTFNHVVPTLDVVNEVFSFLVNIVEINADPPIVFSGVLPTELKKGDPSDARAANTWFLPTARAGAAVPEAKMLEWKGNLPDVLGVLREVKDDVRDSLPELHISRMQQQGAYSGFALNAMLFAFVSKMARMRRTYRPAATRTLSMGLAALDMVRGRSTTFDPLDPRYAVKATLPPVLPIDEDAVINRVVTKLEAGLIGEDDALKELGYPQDEWEGLKARAGEYQAKQQAAVAASQPKTISTAVQRAQKGTNRQPINNQLNSSGG